MKRLIRLLALIILIVLLYNLFSDNKLPENWLMMISLLAFVLSYIGKKLDEKKDETR
ncbi:hypothetical protein HMI01_27610 [Halolactibacillus miurensis]|uniref:Uncharacterized protein n=1 Tax=Halolactibacillus miurensis TaxID=306541 RepID=A0A1I6UL16_9BACI|nr:MULTISPECIES: hypothetical protein [Halolactibacillus]GEM05773.1 hypothetical protein HMI01_27610 [Halolactibacillus miurensis]SFT02113.1 hypothetical protein SAMN05421668_12828 [Halolactibacillus miurensis]